MNKPFSYKVWEINNSTKTRIIAFIITLIGYLGIVFMPVFPYNWFYPIFFGGLFGMGLMTLHRNKNIYFSKKIFSLCPWCIGDKIILKETRFNQNECVCKYCLRLWIEPNG